MQVNYVLNLTCFVVFQLKLTEHQLAGIFGCILDCMASQSDFFNLHFLRVTFASSVFKSSSKSPKCHLKKADSSAAFTNIFLKSVQRVTICSNQQDIRKTGSLDVSLENSQAVAHSPIAEGTLYVKQNYSENETLLSSTN